MSITPNYQNHSSISFKSSFVKNDAFENAVDKLKRSPSNEAIDAMNHILDDGKMIPMNLQK